MVNDLKKRKERMDSNWGNIATHLSTDEAPIPFFLWMEQQIYKINYEKSDKQKKWIC